jgi:hypothetical protein
MRLRRSPDVVNKRCYSKPNEFRVWHETDMSTALRNVRFQGQSGKHMLALSFSGFGPIRTTLAPVQLLMLSLPGLLRKQSPAAL